MYHKRCHWYSCCPLKISLFTVMGRYLSGKSMLSSSVFLVNAQPSLRSVCFMRCRTRPPARCKITHVRQLRRALHPVESLDITRIGSRCQGCGVRGEGRTCLRERTAGQTRGARVEWGLCEAAAAAAGPLAAHRVRQKQKATRTHLRYKAWSRRNHETGSVGGKQTERTANSSQPNLHSPLLIQVWNLINSSEKVNKAFFVRLLHIR